MQLSLAHLLEKEFGDLRYNLIVQLIHDCLLDRSIVDVQLENDVISRAVDASNYVERVVSSISCKGYTYVPGNASRCTHLPSVVHI